MNPLANMNPFAACCICGSLIFVLIGIVVGVIGIAPRYNGKGAKKVMGTVSISLLVIGAALIMCALATIDAEQTCAGCGSVVRNTAYCTNCGTPTHEPESVYVCENCRKEIDTKYCGDCGGKKVLNIPIEVSPTD